MLLENLRRSEALLVFQMIGNDRFARAQGKARRRGEISPDARNPDNSWTPANTGANEEAVLGRDIFKHLAELGAQTFRRQACGIDQQLIERYALQRRDAQLGQDLLLPYSLLQRAQ